MSAAAPANSWHGASQGRLYYLDAELASKTIPAIIDASRFAPVDQRSWLGFAVGCRFSPHHIIVWEELSSS